MDRKTKKVVRKKNRAPKRKNEMRLTDRIRDAVSELKRYESPEIMRQVNQIVTPVSCPAYPIMQRYNKSKKITEEKYTVEEKPKTKFSGPQPFSPLALYRARTPSDGYKNSLQQQRPRKVTSVFQSKEISLAAYLKSNSKNATSLKNSALGKYEIPNQPMSMKGRNRSSQNSQRNSLTQAFGINGSPIDSVNKKNHIYHQRMRYATVVPVHELLKKREHPKLSRRKCSRNFCPGCLKKTNSTTQHSLKKNRSIKKNRISNNKSNPLTYYISPPDLTRLPSSETAMNAKGKKKIRKKKKRKIIARPRELGTELNPKDVTWNKEDIKAFRMVETKQSDITTVVDTPSKSSQLGSRGPAVLTAGSSSGGDVSYRMCKQCPLRQLISKIDPVVGQDKRSYPVVAFTCCRKPPAVKSAIFTQDQKESSSELAFKYAVYKINKDRSLLPNTSLMYDIQYVPRDDSFRTTKKACGQVESGVQGMFGPWEAGLGAHVQSLCEALDLPHMEARLDLDPGFRELSINLHPPQNYLNDAVKDLISFLNWTRVAIVYEEDYGLFKLQELVKGPPGARTEMYIRQANPTSYRHVLREIRQKDIFKVIVDTNPAHMNHFFKAILQLQMNDYRYHYMFTTFDIETFDLEDFKYNSVNMTAFRLIDVENPKVTEILSQMERFQPVGHSILNRSGVIQAEPALVFDSVYVFATGLASLESSHTLRPANLSCDLEVPWQDGPSLYNYINAVTHHGLTGRIEFTEGRRSNFKMDLLKLKREELRKVGEWSPSSGLNITDSTAFYETTTPNITLIVMTREERPYVMVREGNVTGNARYEGFCIDLLKWVATEVGFQYAIRLVPDHKYGVYDPETKQWNGIVRELIEKRADLAVASMTINYARESVIDFTKPFMNLGIGILFKVPSSQPARLFSFMNPLAVEIWLYVLAAYLLVSFTLFVMARFSPYEWNNPHPCSPEAHVIENQFSISNSFWFITGTFLRQGSGLNPKTSERMPNRMFSFLNPLAAEIWLWMLVAYVFVSLTIWVVARFSPREWTLPVSCPCTPGEEEEEDGLLVAYDLQLHNDFTLGNAFWFTLGSLMQQGSDLNPKATSTRIVGGIWWFFTLIIISSYTANLAAFLTVERMITPIESAADLSEQTDIAYGTLDGGSTMTFFRDSKIGIYQKMWRYMESKKPSVFVPSYEEGIKRVLDGNYAFLMESTMLDYAVQRDCNLTQIGGLLDSKGYGIATPKGSPWRDKISLAILELQEKGNIQILYDKWWKNTGDVCNREDKNKESKANALGVENIGGVFVVLLCGLALAILVAILEFCWNSKKNAQTDRQSLCSEMAEELRFAIRCHGSRQRPALKRSCTRCSPGTTYVPSALEIQHINGETSILPMIEMKKSSLSYEGDT